MKNVHIGSRDGPRVYREEQRMFGGTWGVGWKRIQEIKHGRAKEAETRKGLRHGLVRREGRGSLRRAERREERRGGGARSEPSKEKRPVHLMQVRDRSPPPQTITKHEGDLGGISVLCIHDMGWAETATQGCTSHRLIMSRCHVRPTFLPSTFPSVTGERLDLDGGPRPKSDDKPGEGARAEDETGGALGGETRPPPGP